jgi:hypothetical protein
VDGANFISLRAHVGNMRGEEELQFLSEVEAAVPSVEEFLRIRTLGVQAAAKKLRTEVSAEGGGEAWLCTAVISGVGSPPD